MVLPGHRIWSVFVGAGAWSHMFAMGGMVSLGEDIRNGFFRVGLIEFACWPFKAVVVWMAAISLCWTAGGARGSCVWL